MTEQNRLSEAPLNFASTNEAFFNESAQSYNQRPNVDQHVKVLVSLFTAYADLFASDKEPTMTMMDFACGTGLISKALQDYTKRIVGVDISQAMVDEYNKTFAGSGRDISARCVNLLEEPNMLGEKFDIVVCASAYHHFEDVDAYTRSLVAHLKPGGSLLVADLVKPESASDDGNPSLAHDGDHHHGHHDGSQAHQHAHAPVRGHADLFPKEVHHIVAHRGGFSKEDMERTFKAAGLEEFSMKATSSSAQITMHGRHVRLFVARGNVKRDAPPAD
ncbi:S-adenosyl-L-methionine-dependent methyltransferase [Coniophora puteana RWD-64-598 SS2]|uniref:S-adenosyl-L-methionine-dependent methyltransferase n=1 Tax=Coniophora puteana (strain RWD-64-598) TaxID=741705 RepID=A0A5M3N2H7_CONPW|nr:S-adenosyl-L-methionine-dependent methyltransferase [Coniophora puteana RWD-64-598 SS2]EIW85592.1 S-adenosyl-L-methionine-dependent methyltransferase [Coniophora puteana RWD-64-598 SS2]